MLPRSFIDTSYKVQSVFPATNPIDNRQSQNPGYTDFGYWAFQTSWKYNNVFFCLRRDGQQLSSAGHIEALFVSLGPSASQLCQFKRKKIAFAGRMWPAGRMLPSPALEAHSHLILLHSFFTLRFKNTMIWGKFMIKW